MRQRPGLPILLALLAAAILAVGCGNGSTDTTPTTTPKPDAVGFDAPGDVTPECEVDKDCDDENVCTEDFCVLKLCKYGNNKASCDDGDSCTGGDFCDKGTCKAGKKDLCVKYDGPQKGELVITEIMYKPAGPEDKPLNYKVAEWFEVKNVSAKTLPLLGMRIGNFDKKGQPGPDGLLPFKEDDEVEDKTVTIAPGEWFVIGRSKDKAVNGGIDVDLEALFGLTNDADSVVLTTPSGEIIDAVAWNVKKAWPKLHAASLSLSPASTDPKANDKPGVWCGATTKMPSGDLGTPGKVNDECPPTVGPPNCGDGEKDPDEACDDGNKEGGDGCGPWCDEEAAVAEGDLIIAEFLPNPATLADSEAEWIEIINTSDADIDLNGVTLAKQTTSTNTGKVSKWQHVIQQMKPLMLKPNTPFLLAIGDKPDHFGGVEPGYVYGKISLNNTGKVDLMLKSQGQLVDLVVYQGSAKTGHSVSLDPGALDHIKNDDPANWCPAQLHYTLGNFGTPAAANPDCKWAADDADKDGVSDHFDNCDNVDNKEQKDGDKDGVGDACDNCPKMANPNQEDINSNKIGDLCEPPGCGNTKKEANEECDDGNILPADGCSQQCKIEDPIEPGELIVNEFITDPSAVEDKHGEWIELYNPSTADIALNGLEVNAKSTSHVIGLTDAKPVIIKSKGYLILGRNADTKVNGGVTVHYQWTSLNLTNPSGKVTLTWGKTLVDDVTYDSGKDGWPTFAKGAAIQLSAQHTATADNGAGKHWCVATEVFGIGDKGTPGKANLVCIPDGDKDGVPDSKDNCPAKSNSSQGDSDKDGVGNVCDNCPNKANKDQADKDKDGKGDVCDLPPPPVCGDKKKEGAEQCDDGNDKSGDGCSSTCKNEPPNLAAGTLVISEFMSDSGAKSDTVGEWIELYNPASAAVDVEGYTLADNTKSGHHLIANAGQGVKIPGKGYAVFGLSADAKVNGGFTPIYVYEGIGLNNTTDSVRLLNPNGTVIDQVDYKNGGAGWPPTTTAKALQLNPTKLTAVANDDGNNWCLASAKYGDGDLGTPGTANSVCKKDKDGDGVGDETDNCLLKANKDQADGDKDGVGDVCDNCVKVANKDQADGDKDGIGDACAPKCGDGDKAGKEQCDDGNKKDGDGCSAECLIEQPAQTGAIVITELLFDPKAVSDSKGEWLELYNPGVTEVDLDGWKLQTKSKAHTIKGPLKIASKAHIAIGLNKDDKTNGGVTTITYQYSSVSLGNTGPGKLQLFDKADKLVDIVDYETTVGKYGWPGKVSGRAIQLDPTKLDTKLNDAGKNWCLATKALTGGDKGTPGVKNDSCAPPAPPPPAGASWHHFADGQAPSAHVDLLVNVWLKLWKWQWWGPFA